MLPRFSKRWAELYKLRQTVERFFGSAKRSRVLNQHRYLSMDKVAIHTQTSLLTYSVTMLVRLMGGDCKRIRLQGLSMLRHGMTLTEVARALDINYRTVHRWVSWYRNGGLTKVLAHRTR